MSTREPLSTLAGALRAEGGLLAETLVDPAPGATDARARRAASGPRASAAPDEVGLVLAAVREGYLLHYGEGRLVRPDDPDLALLGGDRLFALGLARLAALGDLAAVAELADLISLCAQAQAQAADGGEHDDLAEAAWDAAATAIGFGATPALVRAKRAARAGDADAPELLRAAAITPRLP